MIKINLLPAEVAGRKRRERAIAPKTSSVVLIIIVLCYVFVAGEAWWVYNKSAASNKAVMDLRAERDAKKSQIDKISSEFKTLKALKEIATNQIEILNSLDPPTRLLWAEKINMLAELIPRNVYVTSIVMTEKTDMVVTAESRRRIAEWEKQGKKGPKPPEVKKPVITQTLNLSGVTWDENSEERLQRVVDFYYALKDFSTTAPNGEVRRFMDNFKDNIQIAPITSDRIANVPVRKFEFIIVTKPIT
jgi:Tfp pilus assembly protein PilN